MVYRRRNKLKRRYVRKGARRARTGRGLKGVTSVGFRRQGYSGPGLDAFGMRAATVGRARNVARAALLNRRRNRRTAGGGGEIGFINRRGGRFKRMSIPRLMRLSMNRTTHRFQGVNRMNGPNPTNAPPGYFRLNNDPNSENICEFPLMAFDLTTVGNNNAFSNPVAYQMYIDQTNQSVEWQVVNGQTNTGLGGVNGVNHFVVEDATNPLFSLNSRFIQTDWFDIRAVAYGARNQPTYYDMMIVQFTRDYLQPCNYAANLAGQPAEDQAAKAAFWSGMVKSLSYNAIMPGQRDAFKGMKVLRRFRFTLQPSLTTDEDVNPNMRIVKLFQKHYSLDDYNWGKGSANVTAVATDAPNWTNDTSGSSTLRNHPIERKRTFLIVRASNTTEVALAEQSMDNTPSFDLIIRKQCQVATL